MGSGLCLLRRGWVASVLLFVLSAASTGAPFVPSDKEGWALHPTTYIGCDPIFREPSLDDKIELCTEIIKAGRDTPKRLAEVHVHRGQNYLRKGQPERAIADFTRALELRPDYGTAYFYRCGAYRDLGDHARALSDCNRLVALEPNAGDAYVRRGSVYDPMGDYDRAIADFDRAIALDPKYTDAFFDRGLAYRHKGDYDRAILDYDHVLSKRPNDVDALNNRGLSYFDKRDCVRAMADFDRAIALDPAYANAYNNRALCFLREEQYDRAIAELDRAVALAKDRAFFLKNRATAFLFKEDYDRAIADAERALALRPGYGEAQLILSQAREGKKLGALQATATPTGARIAFVVGNSKYRHEPALPNAAHDAEDVARALAALGYKVYGYPKVDFTRTQLLDAIAEFKRAAIGAEAAVVWYSGHGQEFIQEGSDFGRNWLIPVDAVIESSKDTSRYGVSLGELFLAAMPAKSLRLIVVDSCRDDAFNDIPRVPRGFAREGRLGMFIVYSTKPGSYALDGFGRNSPLAEAFLKVLKETPRADLRQIFATVAQTVRKITNNAQDPETVDRYAAGETLVLAR